MQIVGVEVTAAVLQIYLTVKARKLNQNRGAGVPFIDENWILQNITSAFPREHKMIHDSKNRNQKVIIIIL